jgi:hypothetical protein
MKNEPLHVYLSSRIEKQQHVVTLWQVEPTSTEQRTLLYCFRLLDYT